MRATPKSEGEVWLAVEVATLEERDDKGFRTCLRVWHASTLRPRGGERQESVWVKLYGNEERAPWRMATE